MLLHLTGCACPQLFPWLHDENSIPVSYKFGEFLIHLTAIRTRGVAQFTLVVMINSGWEEKN